MTRHRTAETASKLARVECFGGMLVARLNVLYRHKARWLSMVRTIAETERR